MSPQAFSVLISKLTENAIELLNHDSRYKRTGLAILDALLDVNDEILPDRKILIAGYLRKVLENDKLSVDSSADILRSAALSLGHLARIASTTEIEFLQGFYLSEVVKWLYDSRSEVRRFCGVIILRQLAINSPAIIFNKRKSYFTALWDIIFEKNQLLREAAAEAIESTLVLFTQRENSDEYVRVVLSCVEAGFASNVQDKVHGSMLVVDALLTSLPPNDLLTTVRNVGKKFPDMIWEVLKRKDSKESYIKHKVMELIPKLASTSSAFFLQANFYTTPNNFLSFAMRHLLAMVKSVADRQIAYVALGTLSSTK